MSGRILIRCLIVSVAIALILPVFTFVVVAPIGPDGNPLPSMAIQPTGPTQFLETRELTGFEKYRYMFTNGSWWWWLIYLKASASYFLIALASSAGVCFWNAKRS